MALHGKKTFDHALTVFKILTENNPLAFDP